ncbi:hypothetical protein [Oceanobacillus sp. FSL H7-0719]|uniref:hypothetical protein n=1 Tax=Oceanobacillus sp. FSL H7-0719 TaxID=2954507 RepID=UPI00324C9BAB
MSKKFNVNETMDIIVTAETRGEERVKELKTDGWFFRIGDVYSNPYQASHFKITDIIISKRGKPIDAKIYGYRVHPNDHTQEVFDPDVYEENEWHRAWHFNEHWGLETP